MGNSMNFYLKPDEFSVVQRGLESDYGMTYTDDYVSVHLLCNFPFSVLKNACDF